MPEERSLSIGQCASLACLLEATAPKPGNVHRGADFADVTFAHFATSAVLIGPPLEQAARGAPLGECIYQAVDAIATHVASNTYLGTLLLLAPLAAAAGRGGVREQIGEVLAELSAADTERVYAAIRRAQPGGLGKVDEHDVSSAPPESLLTAMAAAAERDLVARQYVNRFATVLDEAVPTLLAELTAGRTLIDAIVRLHLRLMAQHPDSLIARKCGQAVAEQSAAWAKAVLDTSGEEAVYYGALADFDFWLRSDGNRRNPGTTADLVAAALFVALVEGQIATPWPLG
jgi:triphosphoribosyl-dephospho-CoA synthase